MTAIEVVVELLGAAGLSTYSHCLVTSSWRDARASSLGASNARVSTLIGPEISGFGGGMAGNLAGCKVGHAGEM